MEGDEVDAVALLEIGLCFAGDDRRKMEDDIRTVGHQLAARILARNVERVGVDLAEKTRGRLRRHDVNQRELVDRLAVEPALVNDPRRQLAPDHARRAGNENVHCAPLPNLSCPGRGLHRAQREEKKRQFTREKNRERRRPDGQVHTGSWRTIGSHEPIIASTRPTRFSTGTKPTPPAAGASRLSAESSRLSPITKIWSGPTTNSCVLSSSPSQRSLKIGCSRPFSASIKRGAVSTPFSVSIWPTPARRSGPMVPFSQSCPSRICTRSPGKPTTRLT